MPTSCPPPTIVRLLLLFALSSGFLLLGAAFDVRTAAADSPDNALLQTEPLDGAGVWVDPALETLKQRQGRVAVTVWFDRQFLGDGKAYRRRAAEFADWKRSDLHDAVMATLKSLSLESHDKAKSKLKELEGAGKLQALQRHWIVNGFTAVVSIDALDQLKQVPGVKKIFLARRRGGPMRKPAASNVTTFTAKERPPFRADRYKHPWYARYLLADKVWRELGVTGRGTLNIVHDFNFAFGNHVTANLYRNADEIPGNGKDDDGNGWIDDYHGYNFDADSALLTVIPQRPGALPPQQLHGVLCAAIICGVGQADSPYEFGLAPEAEWAGVIASRRLEAAVEWAVEQGADTYSMSFSIPGLGEYRSHWRKVMEHGSFCGVYFVSGAGNFAQQVPVPVQMRVPEDIPEVVFAAAGVQRDLSRTRFSSKGPVVWNTEHYQDGRVQKPEVCAFNAGLPVIYPNGKVIDAGANGNSFAGPMFCGTIALMLSADPELLPWDLKEIIQSTATDVGPPGIDDETGHGLINAFRAVKEVLRRKAIREQRDAKPYTGRMAGDELDTARVKKLSENFQLVIVRVQPGSQAKKLGIAAGDVVVRFGGKPVTSLVDFQTARRAVRKETELVVRRSGKERSFQVPPGTLGIAIAPKYQEPVFE